MDLLSLPPPSLREARAEAALRGLLTAALLALLLLGLASTPGPSSPADAATSARSPPLRSLAVDLAHDPPSRLRLLPGIGAAHAEAIVRDRREFGPLRALDDLARIHGFGAKTVEALRTAGAVTTRDLAGGP